MFYKSILIFLSLLKKSTMEPVHIFYKELPIDQNNTFTANIALFINQVIDSSVFAITDTDRQEPISSFILKLIKGKKETVLDLKIYNEEMTLDKIIPFQKKNYHQLNLHFTIQLQKARRS